MVCLLRTQEVLTWCLLLLSLVNPHYILLIIIRLLTTFPVFFFSGYIIQLTLLLHRLVKMGVPSSRIRRKCLSISTLVSACVRVIATQQLFNVGFFTQLIVHFQACIFVDDHLGKRLFQVWKAYFVTLLHFGVLFAQLAKVAGRQLLVLPNQRLQVKVEEVAQEHLLGVDHFWAHFNLIFARIVLLLLTKTATLVVVQTALEGVCKWAMVRFAKLGVHPIRSATLNWLLLQATHLLHFVCSRF